jgi:hypothetical protein
MPNYIRTKQIDQTDLSNFVTDSLQSQSGTILQYVSGVTLNETVLLTGNQNISGIKTFVDGVDLNNIDNLNLSGVDIIITSGNVILTNPVSAPNLVNITYNIGDQTISGIKTFVTGIIAPNLVYNVGDQIIGGVKTFSEDLNISGNLTLDGGLYINDIEELNLIGANIYADNIVYNTGDQIIRGLKTFDNRPIVNGTGLLLSGDATAGFTFTGDLNVSLSDNKTFGRYSNGEIIPASGKSLPEVLQLILVEPISPTLSFSSSTVVPFNQTSINNILNASNVINSLNSSVQTGFIEYRRGNAGSYTNLIGNESSSISYTHSLTDTNFNANPFNYRYVVIDTMGAANTGTLTITPVSYVAPTITNISIGGDATLGNVSTTLAVTINRNSPNVDLTSYQLQYQSIINGTTSAWTNIDTSTLISGPSAVVSKAHNDINLVNASSISYRIQIVDGYQTTPLNLGTRSFFYRNYLGYSSNTTLTLAQIESLSSSILSDSKSRTISSVSAGAGNYTYYCYRASQGDLSSIVQDGAYQIFGSFTELSDVVGVNSYGANVTYRVYKSNSTDAFTNVSLVFN